ncbi:hypothetical protein BJF78_32440 [Pseudonocardia sp. CNS-139]|nr:hypothetical protein BJF78_32440 [Pseudonocardia sp. CNS-139]
MDRLAAAVPDLADVWPLSPLQEGLAFHAAHDAADVYVAQQVVEISGDVDPARLRAAAHALQQRHALLRTSYHSDGLDRTVAVVHMSAEPPWREDDLTGQPATALDDCSRRSGTVPSTSRARRCWRTRSCGWRPTGSPWSSPTTTCCSTAGPRPC